MISDFELEQKFIAALINSPEELHNIESFFDESDLAVGDDADTRHRTIFTIIKQAVQKNESINPTIVCQRLKALNISSDADDMPIEKYAHALSLRKTKEGSVLPIARELKKLAARRNFCEAGEEIIQRMNEISPSSSYVEIIEEADRVFNKRINHFELEGDVPVNIYDEMEAIIEDRGNNPASDFGMLGPFPTVNKIYGSLVREGNVAVICARAKSGKMQPLYSKVLTPDGWKTMGEIKKGDFVMSENLSPVLVTNTFDHTQKDVYRVYFGDGRTVDCGGEHLWKVWARSYANKKGGLPDWQVIDTEKIIQKLSLVRDRVYVPMVSPIKTKKVDLPIDPYFLGVLIGDGCITQGVIVESEDEDIINKCLNSVGEDFFVKKYEKANSKSSRYTFHCKSSFRKKKNPLWVKLLDLGLAGKKSYEKFIPEIYLNASTQQKFEILMGLMDTDGTISLKKEGWYCGMEYATSSETLAKQVQTLAWGLGARAKISTRKPFYRNKNGDKVYCRISYRVRIQYKNPTDFFWCKRKKDKTLGEKTKKTDKLEIIKIEKLPQKEDCRCLEIDSPTHLYVTDNFIVTHNTTLALDYTTFIADRYDVDILHLDNGEMSKEELIFRQCAALSGVPLYLIETGKWRNAGPEIVAKIRSVWPRVKKLRFYYFCVGGMSADEMISLTKKFYYNTVGRGKKMIISFDYLKPPGLPNGNVTEWQIIGEIINKFKKLLAKDILFEGNPMISMFTSVQSNRAGITTNKKADNITDDESVVSLSDRIIQYCSHMFLLRRKTMDEMQDEGEDFGTHKLICLAARHLGEDVHGHLEPVKVGDKLKQNFINLEFKNFQIEEKGDLRDIVQAKSVDTDLKSDELSDTPDF